MLDDSFYVSKIGDFTEGQPVMWSGYVEGNKVTEHIVLDNGDVLEIQLDLYTEGEETKEETNSDVGNYQEFVDESGELQFIHKDFVEFVKP